MQAPMNEYYTSKEYEYALKQMYRMMERQRAILEAQSAQIACRCKREEFSSAAKKSAEDTKTVIKRINSQMDEAIQGKIRSSLEDRLSNLLGKYDQII